MPERVDRGGEPEIEVGKINGDEDVGALRVLARSTSRRYIAYVRGSTRRTSVRPVTAMPAVVARQLRAGRRQPLAAEPDDARAGR